MRKIFSMFGKLGLSIAKAPLTLLKSVGKFIGLKGIIIAVLIFVIIALVLFGIGGGFGQGAGDGEGDGNASVITTQDKLVKEENDNVDSEKLQEDVKENDEIKEKIIAVNIVDSDYFYENEKINLDDLINKINEIDGIVIVEIREDNASLKAYNNLTGRLKGEKIKYVDQ